MITLNKEGKMKKRRALTLIELILAITIATMVIIAASSVLYTALDTSKISKEEFSLQSEMRDAVMRLNEIIQKSSAVFANSDEAINQDKTWGYIYISSQAGNEGQLVISNYDTASNTWVETPLTRLSNRAHFDIEFIDNTSKINYEKVVEYDFTGLKLDDSKNEVSGTSRTINNAVESGNADKFIYNPQTGKKAVVLAVKNDKKEDEMQGVVALVIDRSSQMHTKMNDGTYKSELVMEELVNVINELDNDLNIDLTFTRFDARAKSLEKADGTNFINLKGNKNAVLAELANAKYVPAKHIEGSSAKVVINSNFGDGYRLALYGLKDYEDYNKLTNPNFKCKKYIIIFTVGIPAYHSLDGIHFVTDDRKQEELGYRAIAGLGDPRITSKGAYISMDYIRKLKEDVEPALFGAEPLEERPKVILVLTGSPQLEKWDYVINNPHGANRQELFYWRLEDEIDPFKTYICNDESSVKDTMKAIKRDIESTAWQLKGPETP